MIITFIVLEMLDLLTTLYALSVGLVEANPVMAALAPMEMILAKVLLTAVMAIVFWKIPGAKVGLLIGIPAMALVVANNLYCILV